MPRASEEAGAVGRSLVGAWSLLECAEIMQDGSKRLPLGEGARGQVVYTADGRMSAQLVRADRAPFASDDYRGARSRSLPAVLRLLRELHGRCRRRHGDAFHRGRLVLEPRDPLVRLRRTPRVLP